MIWKGQGLNCLLPQYRTMKIIWRILPFFSCSFFHDAVNLAHSSSWQCQKLINGSLLRRTALYKPGGTRPLYNSFCSQESELVILEKYIFTHWNNVCLVFQTFCSISINGYNFCSIIKCSIMSTVVSGNTKKSLARRTLHSWFIHAVQITKST